MGLGSLLIMFSPGMGKLGRKPPAFAEVVNALRDSKRTLQKQDTFLEKAKKTVNSQVDNLMHRQTDMDRATQQESELVPSTDTVHLSLPEYSNQPMFTANGRK